MIKKTGIIMPVFRCKQRRNWFLLA